MDPTAPNSGGGAAADATGPTNTTVTLPPLTLRDVPRLPSALASPSPSPVVPNPISRHPYFHPPSTFYISPGDVSLRHAFFDLASASPSPLLAYRRAGPRGDLAVDPARARAALVTCGGLCPGLNTVLRELVVGLHELYGVRDVFGVAAGYRGFYGGDEDHVRLEPAAADDWHKKGGTVLKTTRGGFDLGKIVDGIVSRGYTQVYAIGGDGTMRGAVAIFQEFKRRGLNISITGIPKTVDNDIGIIDRSFGFQTAVEIAQQAIDAAHVEAVSAVNGIGLVKLMGRSTGHIALHATLSSRDVDCCLIPEVDFCLEGKGGLFEFLYERIKKKGHAVVVVAEGAGQELIHRTDDQKREQDESGNIVFLDVGPWLKSELGRWWKREHPDELFTVKYIDPTYMIRAVPANATDNLYCTLLAHSAIHGIMAGFTGFVPGPINGTYSYIPLEDIAVAKNPVDVNDHKWAWVRSVTNQPDFLMSQA
ncbi:ATP-dependent 6-phosphofructokinase 2 [Dichanthelium oligosanthes]|uniref:ATP-dependent 6-phosphofructokinase 2 n=1 Tax=Dichanthelium oligosanthes TaxID=888268 RepID=A0A1E5WCF8_9POAL|nr:ATP-dependent 6-phosphofructokinase 2 [Dichanthelium oligosanthes]